MARLFDFRCDTCGRTFERMLDGDTHEVPCDRAPTCTGVAERQLGGHAAFSGCKTRPTNTVSRYPRELPGYVPQAIRDRWQVYKEVRGAGEIDGQQVETILSFCDEKPKAKA